MSESDQLSLKHHWIIEVIQDLRIYAQEHDLVVMEDSLDTAMIGVLVQLNLMAHSPCASKEVRNQDSKTDHRIIAKFS